MIIVAIEEKRIRQFFLSDKIWGLLLAFAASADESVLVMLYNPI